jgi:hypothetical protein
VYYICDIFLILLIFQELEALTHEEKSALESVKVKTQKGLTTQKYLYGSTWGVDAKVIIVAEGELVTVNGSAGELMVR